MRKSFFLLMLLAMGVASVDADLISNGDFDSPGDWGYAAYPTSPPNWINYDGGLGATGANYGGQDIYGNGDQPAAMKNSGLGTYLQQGFAGVDAGTTGLYTIGLDLGLRQHSHYQRDVLPNPTQAGDILTLRVSLWDTTADVELAGQTFTRAYPDQPYVNDIDNMTAELFNLTYDNSGLSGHGVAIRLTHLTPLEDDESLGYKTMLLDHVTVLNGDAATLVLPTPSGVEGVVFGTMLEWAAPANYSPDDYRVYFGTTEPNSLLTNYGLTELTAASHPFTATTIAPDSSPLEGLTTYYWVVDSHEPGTAADVFHSGYFWSFTTVTAEAEFDEDSGPFGQTVAAGDEVVFSVSGINITDYQWYGPTGIIAGEVSDTLTISDVQLANEGIYYCEVDNSENSNLKTSTEALLMTKRDVAQWDLESDLTDSVGSNNGTVGTPVYVTDGIVGSQSLEITPGDPNTVMDVPHAAELNNSQSFTIEAWVKPASFPNYGGIVSNRGSYLDEDVIVVDGGYALYTLSSGRVGFWVHDGTAATAGSDAWHQTNTTTDDVLTASEWNYVVATFDNGTATVYVNGKQGAQESDQVMKRNSTTDLQIGAGANEEPEPAFYFDGLIDQVKISSDVIDAYAVANNYVAQFPEVDICVDQAALTSDLDGDCDVDLADFALMASEWLDCNRVAGTSSGLTDCK